MTREEARNWIASIKEKYINGGDEDFDEKRRKALDMAIEELEKEPTTKNDLGVDCISRQAVIDMTGLSEWFDSSDSYNEFVFALNELPSVTPQEPKTGHWIEQEGWDGDVYYKCSVCREPFCLIDGTPTDNMYNYCPNCGAKMEVENDRG